jgi:hypothetical protein
MNQILPQRIDNTYRGLLALWLFIPVVVVKTGIALGTIFNAGVVWRNRPMNSPRQLQRQRLRSNAAGLI